MKKKATGVLVGSLLFMGFASGVSAEDDRDCDSFSSPEEVMEFWVSNGYNEDNDPHRLDADNDNRPCEVPEEVYDSYMANQETAPDDSDDQTTASDDDSNDQDAATSDDSDEQGEALPDTASNNPLMMLIGAGLAGAGSVLAFRRKKASAN